MMQSSAELFSSHNYYAHTKVKLEHLAGLGLPIDGASVLEVGSGIGNHIQFFLDRGCTVTTTEAREENLRVLRERYGKHPQVRVEQLDLDAPSNILGDTKYDIVYCYGMLYHLGRPDGALKYMAEHCGGFLLIESCVSMEPGEAINPCNEPAKALDQSYHGLGCRPTRLWIWNRLKELFEHIYMPTTQPRHPEFPLNWRMPIKNTLTRAVFVASRTPLKSATLVEEMPLTQSNGSKLDLSSTGFDTLINIPEFQGSFEISRQSDLLKQVMNGRTYEPEVTKICQAHLKKNRDAIDVGANIGFYTVLFAKMLDAGRKVLAVEPTPGALLRLKKNLKINQVESKVILFEGAASDVTGQAEIKTVEGREEYSSLGTMSHPSVCKSPYSVSMVSAKTIDALVLEHGLDPGLVKIDVEGMELTVLRGMTRTMIKHRPIILSELWTDDWLKGNGSSSEQIIGFVKRHGYNVTPIGGYDILCIPV